MKGGGVDNILIHFILSIIQDVCRLHKHLKYEYSFDVKQFESQVIYSTVLFILINHCFLVPFSHNSFQITIYLTSGKCGADEGKTVGDICALTVSSTGLSAVDLNLHFGVGNPP